MNEQHRERLARIDENAGRYAAFGLSRRQLLKMGALGIVTIGVGAACGDDGSSGSGSDSGSSGGGDSSSGNDTSQSEDTTPAAASADLGGAPVVSLVTSLGNAYYDSWDVGAKSAVEAFGGEYRLLLNEGDPATEISQFEQQIDAGARIFFITAPDPANIPQLARIATENDAFLVNTWESPPWYTPFDGGAGYVTYFIPQSIEAGYIMGKTLFEAMGGEGGFIQISGAPGGTPDWQRTAGLMMAMEEFPGVELLDSAPGFWNRDDARTAAAGMVTRYGDDIKGGFGQNDDCGIGILNALTEASIEDVPITGIDGNPETVELIKQGRYHAAYSSLPPWQAGFGAVRAIDAFLGFEPTAPERQMWTGGVLVNADNADNYVNAVFNSSDAFDWKLMSRVEHPDDFDPQLDVSPIELEQMWGGSGEENPGLPDEYVEAVDSGQFDEIAQLYANNFKRKVVE